MGAYSLTRLNRRSAAALHVGDNQWENVDQVPQNKRPNPRRGVNGLNVGIISLNKIQCSPQLCGLKATPCLLWLAFCCAHDTRKMTREKANETRKKNKENNDKKKENSTPTNNCAGRRGLFVSQFCCNLLAASWKHRSMMRRSRACLPAFARSNDTKQKTTTNTTAWWATNSLTQIKNHTRHAARLSLLFCVLNVSVVPSSQRVRRT